MLMDSDYAQDKVSCTSRSGFLIYVNTALVQWFSMKQSTVETLVFGAEFITMKQGIYTLRGLRYKLRMRGILIYGPSYIYGVNMSVAHNTSRPESVLRKKSNSVCYHAFLKSVAAGESLVGHIPTKENATALMMKVLYRHKIKYLVSNILYNIHKDHHLAVLASTDYNQATMIPLVIVSTLRGLERCGHSSDLNI